MSDPNTNQSTKRRKCAPAAPPRLPSPSVDLARPSSDGLYWLGKVRAHHPATERAARNRFQREGGYLFYDEDEDGVTEEERDEMLSSTWRDEFLRREELVGRMLRLRLRGAREGGGGGDDDDDDAGPEPPVGWRWCPPGYEPRSLASYEFVINFFRKPSWGELEANSKAPRPQQRRNDVVTIVTAAAELAPSPGCDGYWDLPCSRHRGGEDFGSSVRIDLTPWKDGLPKLFTSERYDDRPDSPEMEILVIKKDGSADGANGDGGRREHDGAGLTVARLYSGGQGPSFVHAKPYYAQYHYRAFSGPSWFGDECFDDIHGSEEGNPDRPWLPRVEPYLHTNGKDGAGRWELHLGIKWGGKGICERYAPMGDRDIRAFLERGLAWEEVGRESDELSYLHDDAARERAGARCWSRTSTSPSSSALWRLGVGRAKPEHDSGWSAYSYDLDDIMPQFTFLIDLCYDNGGENDGTSSLSPGTLSAESRHRANIISVDIPTSGRVQDGKLFLNITNSRSKGAMSYWLSGRKDREIGGMITVIERKTGKQAQLFAGTVVTNIDAKPPVGRGYKYFQQFTALHYFSKDEAYSRVIWPETTLGLSTGGDGDGGRVSFVVGFHWFDSRKKTHHIMEEHLVQLFFKHALAYN